jgi:hypothetical protein
VFEEIVVFVTRAASRRFLGSLVFCYGQEDLRSDVVHGVALVGFAAVRKVEGLVTDWHG